MQFSSLSEFISMGGYGFYVWLSFGSATLILSLLLIVSKKGHYQVIASIAQRQVREEKLNQARLIRAQQGSDSANPSVKVSN
jgi:heme exporter protein D